MDDEKRDLLPGVIGPAERRIVSVIGGDDHQVRRRDLIHEFAEPFVELYERSRVTIDLAAMAVDHVEIDEVREDESVFEPLPVFLNALHAFGVSVGWKRFS